MANFNSVPAFVRTSAEEDHEALGITRFIGESGWTQIIAGLIHQGGIVTESNKTQILVPFHLSYPKQVLGIFCNPAIFKLTPTLTNFTIETDGSDIQFYWWAVGV